MAGPFNNQNVDGTGFYVPFFASPIGPAARDAAGAAVRHGDRPAARRRARRGAGARAAQAT
jgi:hypothetical protein